MEAFAVNTFILCYLLFVVLYDAPKSFAPRRMLNRPLSLIASMGFGHTWAMYAPDPPQFSTYLEVYFLYDGGERRRIDLPFIPSLEDRRHAANLRFITFMRSAAGARDAQLHHKICAWALEHGRRDVSKPLEGVELMLVRVETPPFPGDVDRQSTIARKRLYSLSAVDV